MSPAADQPFDPLQRSFLDEHRWAVLATGRRDGSPQQSMVGYAVDGQGRLIISAKSYTAKWANAVRAPRVSLCVADGRAHLVVYGTAETIDADPERAELTADVFAVLGDGTRPDPSSIVGLLDEQRRTVLRITPERVLFHE
jgi:PPOX class probable F420-dependent enzyme